MDDDYEARMKERAARRAAAKAAAGEAPAPVESTPASAPPVDDYESRVRERALKRENSKKNVNEEVSRESSPKKEEEEEEEPKQQQEEEAPKRQEEEEEEEQEEEEQEQEEAPKRQEEPEEEQEQPKKEEPEEEAPKKEPTPPKEVVSHQEDEDSYKKPRSSSRNQIRSSVATSTPASSSTSRSTPTPAATTTTTTSAPSSRFGSSTTPASSTPVSRSAGRDRPVSVASPPTEKKDFRSNRFSVAPETNSAPPAQSSEEAPKRKTISLASKSQEAEDMVKRIVEGDEDVTWVLFNCDQNVQIHAQGVGEVEALKAKLDDAMVLYGYIRVPVGAEGRTKFVYIRWVGTKIKPIQRAKALDNEKVIKSFTRVYHIEVHTSERDELTSSKVNDKLARAGGANYDKSQNTGGKVDSNASFSSYKERSRDFFYEKEREGNVKKVVFEKGPIGRTTPVNLAGRSMTVGAASANKNLVDLKTKKSQE